MEKYSNRAVTWAEGRGYPLHLWKFLYEDQKLDRNQEQISYALELGLNEEQRQQAEQLLQGIEDKT